MIEIDNYSYRSPNFGPRPINTVINSIVIHYTEMTNSIEALKRLTSPEFQVSCHYLICKTGKIYSLVDDKFRAWHAGTSCWRNKENLNNYSIGIELDNNGHEDFSENLIYSLLNLLNHLTKMFPIDNRNIVGHSDVIPTNKFDPGRYFPWERLALSGYGIWFENEKLFETRIPSLKILTTQLNQFGYNIIPDEKLNIKIIAAMRAFNERFHPENKELWCKKSQQILEYFLYRLFS